MTPTNKLIVAIAVAMTAAILMLAATKGSIDSPNYPNSGSCPAGAEHRPSLDPMSNTASQLRAQGYLVGTDGAGGSCVDEG